MSCRLVTVAAEDEFVGSFAFHLIGAGRGGTSLIAGLLDAHPKAHVEFERLSAELLMGRTEFAEERLLDPTSRAPWRIARFVASCKAEADLVPDKLWGHKTTTEHIGSLTTPFGTDAFQNTDRPLDDDALLQVVTALRDVPTIFILRDGRTCVRSKVERTGQAVDMAIRRWKFSIHVLGAFKRHHPRFLTIRFEDLVVSPRPVLDTVCAFLGIDFDEAMIAGTANPKMLPEYRYGRFDRSKIAYDDAADAVAPSVAALLPELEQAGYTR
jgi:hypothetical protein